MIRKTISSFIFLIVGQLLYAQADTLLKNQLIIKINPGLLFSEQGLMLQFNTENNFALLLGGGYNEDINVNPNYPGTGGTGYTIRAGALQYLDNDKKYYFSFQGFYRYYGNITAIADHSQGFTQGIDDGVINPLRTNVGSVSVGTGNPIDVYNASVSVLCFDAIFGYQYRKKHFVLDLFAGLGSRSKTINLSEVGYYVNPLDRSIGPYIPYGQPMNKVVGFSYVDVKLGFTLGYRIF